MKRIRINRNKTNFPIIIEECSKLNTLLMRLNIRKIDMTWRPTICSMIQEHIITQEQNTTYAKWTTIQEHIATRHTRKEKTTERTDI